MQIVLLWRARRSGACSVHRAAAQGILGLPFDEVPALDNIPTCVGQVARTLTLGVSWLYTPAFAASALRSSSLLFSALSSRRVRLHLPCLHR